MATEQKAKSNVKINPLISEQGEFALGEARRLYDERSQSPLPSQYVGIGTDRQEALDRIAALARGGAGAAIANPAIAEYQKTLSGGYLNSNPYLDEIVRRSVGAAGAAPVSQFATQGRMGSGVMANAMQDAMQQTASNIYGQNYQTERDRMMSMIDRGPALNEAQYADANRLGQVGMSYEQDQAQQNQETMRQYQAEIDRLREFLSMMQGNPLMGEKTMSSNTLGLDYGAMAQGGAQLAASMFGGGGG